MENMGALISPFCLPFAKEKKKKRKSKHASKHHTLSDIKIYGNLMR